MIIDQLETKLLSCLQTKARYVADPSCLRIDSVSGGAEARSNYCVIVQDVLAFYFFPILLIHLVNAI